MPRKPISFELDFMIKDIFPRFTVKQFDDVSFNIKPKNQGLDYNTTGMIGKIFVGVNNDMFMQTTGITVSNNNINILLDKNMLQKSGRAYAEVELTDNAGTITSSSFIFDIDPKIGEGGMIPGEYEGFVEKYERLISEFKSQVNSCVNNANALVNKTINNCNTNVDNKLNTVDGLINIKISDFEKRFNRLTVSQQQSTEVIDAREDFKGNVYDSLKERIDYTDKILRESTVSTVETESDFTTVEATSNGYFEDVKLEGKTLVNLFGSCNKKGTIPNQYSILDSSKISLEIGKTYTLITKANVDYALKSYNTDTSLCMYVATEGYVVKTFNATVNELVNIIVITSNGDYNIDIILLEGDHTQNPPAYFEGLKSVGESASEDGAGEIVVSSVKGDGNLFNECDFYFEDWQCNKPIPNGDGSFTLTPSSTGGVAYVKSKLFNLKVGETYKLDVEILNSTQSTGNNYYVWRGDTTENPYNVNAPFTVYEGSEKVRLAFYVPNGNLNNSVTYRVNFYKYKNKNIPYTPHQSDKKRLLCYNEETQTWEKPILRQWDSIEKHSDGKYYYHQRSGEVVLNGSESDDAEMYSINDTLMQFNIRFDKHKLDIKSCVNDKFSFSNFDDTTSEGIQMNSSGGGMIVIRILKSKLSTQDIEGFKQWLQANNVTVVYQLAEEKVYECTNMDLITYANETNYIVESGAIAPKSTLKVHNNISNVVSLLQKKVSLLENNITSYMITQNRLMLASRYNADNVTFKVDYPSMMSEREVEIDYDLFKLIQDNIIVGPENYDVDKMLEIMDLYAMIGFITWEMWDYLYEVIDSQINPVIEDLEGTPEI